MGGLGEEINRGKALGAVAFGGQESKITGHGLRIAADIDHPAGGHLDDGGEGGLVAALAGRVEDDDVRVEALGGELGRGFARIGAGDNVAAIAMQEGGSAADVWIVSRKPVERTSLLPAEEMFTRNMPGSLPSRAADNLFWLGRYIERAEGALRILRACHERPVSAEKINEMVNKVETELFNGEEREIPSSVIGEKVMHYLKDLDQVAYVRFASIYREFKDVNTFMDELKKMLDK